MRFLPFDFVFNQNEVVFNVKLEQTNARLALFHIILNYIYTYIYIYIYMSAMQCDSLLIAVRCAYSILQAGFGQFGCGCAIW